MAIWLVKLGVYGAEDFREDLAKGKPSLIMISYGIDADISNTKSVEDTIDIIKKQRVRFFPNCKNFDRMEKPDASISQTLNFRYGVEKGDYVISPFHDNGKRNTYRIGKFTGNLQSLESQLGQNAFKTFCNKHKNAAIPAKAITHEVDWITRQFFIDELNDAIYHQIYDSNHTVKALYCTIKPPHGLVKDPKNIPWIP